MSSKRKTELLNGFGNLAVVSDLDSNSYFLHDNHNLSCPTPGHFKRNCQQLNELIKETLDGIVL